MTQEALKLALEALEGVLDDAPKVLDASISGGLYEVVQCREAITAIKEALAQHDSVQAKPEPEQEPVAYWKEHAQGLQRDYDSLLAEFQAQRTWVGLTNEEIEEIWENNDTDWESIKKVEAKLKELNT
jgi:hypothetical protein